MDMGDAGGHEPVYAYMAALARKGDKDSRIKMTKIQDYLDTVLKVLAPLGKTLAVVPLEEAERVEEG